MKRWCDTYDLLVRLLPDVPLRIDGVRSTNDRFRVEIEQILDVIVPQYTDRERLVVIRASEISDAFAELNVGAPTGHVGGDGEGAFLSGAGDDFSLLAVILGVEDRVRDLLQLEHSAHRFR